ncbi:hypothetical protein AMTR_s00045p00065380 [Amborella trichopoda]|uniref:Uncharacterized protein n=1 Tax=Amborella trichopoda TaxID=13333 RepID=W1P227_AMBTC|nr:hypothetical protein AMTR_s00045p00065380 [Amborella trichopoda]
MRYNETGLWNVHPRESDHFFFSEVFRGETLDQLSCIESWRRKISEGFVCYGDETVAPAKARTDGLYGSLGLINDFKT